MRRALSPHLINILLMYLAQVIIEPNTMFWRQIGGHLKKVETCSVGVTWGIGYDSTAWVYTSGWGSVSLKGIDFSFATKKRNK